MEIELSDRLSALAHPNRLALFRLLMRRYPDGVPAGEIAQALKFKANTASAYLSALKQAGLITQQRTGTSLMYAANLPGLRGMFDALLSGCCRNRPDICSPALSGETIAPDAERPLNVLFVCTGNSARSLLAEAILNHEGGGKFRAYSAGTRPSAAPRPEVMSLLQAKEIDTSGLHSKDLSAFTGPDAPQMDFIFTVCDHAANDECPAWPGQPMSAHWGLADPAKATGTDAERRLAFQQAYGLLRNRIKAFAALPFETLDRMSLQHQVDSIAGMNSTD
ncbi:arsenate reductase/protein-tyrosine-phosphatase family protein [Leisingera sp. McT4-56]|uniref:arsenate reductase/protein-tyrosine-phosphatase family protein n=1 Tax=Leisingera sp. McT4-56 TaxID=2881255 RepID=UPI001CF90C18|nr:helix-turn-helix domain-containing protein [Leisingera sp. McT4-56]MCB4454236.1 helix-turn-helix domain-containing protein [Leisingera sp. McT4-56]